MRLAPSEAIADLIYERAAINTQLSCRELMWGMPDQCCVRRMAENDGDSRWQTLFAAQARRLLADLEEQKEVRYGRRTSTADNAAISGLSTAMPEYDPVDSRLGMVTDEQPAESPMSRRVRWDQRLRSEHALHGLRRTRTSCPTSVSTVTGARHGDNLRPTRRSRSSIWKPAGRGAISHGQPVLAKGSNLCHGTGQTATHS